MYIFRHEDYFELLITRKIAIYGVPRLRVYTFDEMMPFIFLDGRLRLIISVHIRSHCQCFTLGGGTPSFRAAVSYLIFGEAIFRA